MQIKHSFLFIAIAALLFQFQNCSKVAFSTKASDNGAQGVPCSTVIQNYNGDLRVIFMVDNSGSTLTTDPKFYYRQQTITDFLAKYGSKTNFTYAFGEFGANSSSLYDSSTGTFVTAPATPFGNAQDLQNALNLYVMNQIDSNANTPYQIAFDAITQIIQNDNAAGLTAPSYSVVFMSDGQPNPNNSLDELKTMVDGVLNAAVAKKVAATVSTVYFGPESSAGDMTAMNNLEVMATEGKGQFYDTNNPPAGGLVENVLTIPGQTQVCSQGN